MRGLRREQMIAVAASASIALALAGAPAHAGTESPSGQGTPTTDTDPTSDPTADPTPTQTNTWTTTPEPTEEPTSEPTDESTEQPTGTPTGEPTEEPTGTPTGEPTQEPTQPPTSLPTTVPTAPPEGEGNGERPIPADPDEAYQQALDGAQTVAVAEAQRLLARVMAEMGVAQKSFAEASAAADEARRADEAARQELAIAEQAAARTQREIDELVERTKSTRDQLGIVARAAYQGDSLATLGVVLGAETPAELTDRYVGMRTLLRTGDSALGQMAVDQAELRNAHARLVGQRQQRRDRAADASASRAAMEAAELAAQQAHAVLDDKSGLVEAALQAAEEAKLEDYRMYIELIDESTAIGQRLAGIDYGPGYGTGTFLRPGTGATTSAYGPRLHPILGYVKTHTGLDFGRGDGKIYAADSGTVIEATWNDAYGNMVIVDHGEWGGQRLTTMYAHQADLIVRPGQKVEKGQVIGNIGSTGYSTGAHLHFEVRLDGQHTDPWLWIAQAPYPS